MTYEQDDTEIQPIPVRVVGAEKEAAAVFGAWVKHTLLSTDPPRQILPEDTRRKRAVIVVSGAGGIYIGSPGQVQNAAVAAASAGELSTGAVVTSESASEQWVLAQADTVVSVLIERYL